METKVCKECGRELPVENFHKGRAKGVEFVMSICHECWHERQIAGRRKAKEKRASNQIDLVEDAKRKKTKGFIWKFIE